MSMQGAAAPTPLELELLRDLAFHSQDSTLRVAVGIAQVKIPPGPMSEAVRRANVRCLQELDRWRETQTTRVDTPRLIDMAVSAARGSDYYALRMIRIAMECPAVGAAPEQERAFETCLTAWNSRAARLAGAA